MENRSSGHHNPHLGTAAGGGGQGEEQRNLPCPAGATLRWAKGKAHGQAEPPPLGEQKWENTAQEGLVYVFFPGTSVGLTRQITYRSPKSFPIS